MGMSVDMLTEAADKLGREHGERRAEWVEKFNLTSHAAKNIIAGYESSDEKTMDLCPSPLSGEWADEPTHLQIIDQIANLAEAAELLQNDDIEDAIEQSSNILDVYEAAYRKGFWAKVINTCNTIVGADK